MDAIQDNVIQCYKNNNYVSGLVDSLIYMCGKVQYGSVNDIFCKKQRNLWYMFTPKELPIRMLN